MLILIFLMSSDEVVGLCKYSESFNQCYSTIRSGRSRRNWKSSERNKGFAEQRIQLARHGNIESNCDSQNHNLLKQWDLKPYRVNETGGNVSFFGQISLSWMLTVKHRDPYG